jgi:hypothetical protein
MPNVAFFNTHPDAVSLQHFGVTVAVRVKLPGNAKYAIFGKVTIHNSDGDPQNASAQLGSADGSNVIDKTDIRVDGRGNADAQALTVQGVLDLTGSFEDIIDMRCATFNGEVREASLVAIQVDDLKSADP